VSVVAEVLDLSLSTQGDTGSASRLRIQAKLNGILVTDPFAVRVRVCNAGVYADSTNATIAPDTGYGTTVATHQAGKDLDILSMSSNSAGVLTISGVVVDGETVTIGSQVYEFDVDGATTGDNVVVDISGDVTAAEGLLTVDTQPTILDSMIIAGQGYVFVADGDEDSPGEISIGTDLATAQAAIVAAINGSDGHNNAHALVTASAFAADDCTITAVVGGTAGNAFDTIETFTEVTNVFDATTMGTETLGADCIAADAVTALAAAITGDGSAVVTGVDGAGDTVDVVAIAPGAASDSIATTETMVNGAFGAATLALGSIPSQIFVNLTDGSVETVTVRLGAPEVEGLNTSFLDTALDVAHAAP